MSAPATRRCRAVAVVFGARGTLGSALVARARARRLAGRGGGRRAPTATSPTQRAVRELLARTRPDVVFNAAAYTDVDRAESEPDLAHAVERHGRRDRRGGGRGRGAAVVRITRPTSSSTARAIAPYDERDPPSPQGNTRSRRWRATALVAAANPRHFILRVGCLYGHGGRNFPSTIVRRLRAGETIRADRDRLASPTWVREVAAVSAALAATDAPRSLPLHRAGRDDVGRLRPPGRGSGGRARRARAGVAYADLPLKALRPLRAILDNRALRALGLDTLSAWQDALRAFVAEETAPGRERPSWRASVSAA